VPARELAIVLNAMNERTLYGTFSGARAAVAEEDVVDVLLEVWIAAIYGTAAPAPTAGPSRISGRPSPS
jgi:TetR/AcrR family transcriptional regulator, ethionamide resistance regulator